MSVASDTQHGVDFPKGLLTIKMCCADRGAGNHEAVCWGWVIMFVVEVLQHRHICVQKQNATSMQRRCTLPFMLLSFIATQKGG